MAMFRCVVPVSFLSDAEYQIYRPFDSGDEIETACPLDERYIGKRGPHFVRLDKDPPLAEEDLDLTKKTVDELRELADELGFAEETKGLKKDELVKFLDGLETE